MTLMSRCFAYVHFTTTCNYVEVMCVEKRTNYDKDVLSNTCI